MAVGLTRDGCEALRREVQGISQSSTRRSAYSKRHVGAPNRRTKQVKLLVDHRCSGVTVRKVAGNRVEAHLSQRSIADQRRPPLAGSQPGQPASAGAPRRVSSPEIFALRATVTYERVEADG